MKDTLKKAEQKMTKSTERLKGEFSSIRAGRANPAVLDKVMVDYYGTPTPVNQMAAVSVSESRILVIQPWDASSIKAIEKAILTSDVGITPTNDGKALRLVFPQPTEDRRKELCKEIKKYKSIPVIMLSARGEEYDKLFGFELGIDDYVVKPFSPKELMARIKAVIKRNSRLDSGIPEKLKFEGLEIDLAGREVYVDGVKASMTPKEYDLLFYLVKNKNLALTRDKLLEEVWGYDFFGDDRTVDTHIKMLRNSLGPYRKFIVTLRGMGYKFEYGQN